MKQCRECGCDLIVGENLGASRLKRFHYICNPCENVKKRKAQQAKRKFVQDYKMVTGCEKCGWNEHFAGLHLAHKERNTKTTGQNYAYNQGWSIERIEKELELCKILCANCHAIETYEENYGDNE